MQGSERGGVVEQGVEPMDPVWAVPVSSTIVFFSILFCFVERIELVLREFSLPILAGMW